MELARWGEVDEVVRVHSPIRSVAERGDCEGANAEAKHSTSAMERLILFRMDGQVRLAGSLTEYMSRTRREMREDGETAADGRLHKERQPMRSRSSG